MGALQIQRYTKFTIDGKATGSTLLMTTENGTETFHPTFIIFALTAGSAVVTPPTVSLGTNSTSYNNILPATLLSGLLSTGTMTPTTSTAGSIVVPANTGIFCNVSIGAVATTATLKITVLGYYE